MGSFETGQIVFSKCGRDKGLPFVILRIEGDFLYLADGRIRTLENPKKKKFKHVQPTNTVNPFVASAVCGNRNLLDADLRKAVEPFLQST